MGEESFFVTDANLSPRQRQTLAARQTFAKQFASPEERSQHYRSLADKANAGRVVLSAEEASALSQAYRLLTRIAERGKLTPPESLTSLERTPDVPVYAGDRE